jgi:hypothetical protein
MACDMSAGFERFLGAGAAEISDGAILSRGRCVVRLLPAQLLECLAERHPDRRGVTGGDRSAPEDRREHRGMMAVKLGGVKGREAARFNIPRE